MDTVFINQKKEIVDVSIYELRELQQNLKRTTKEAYRQFKERILAEGFKYLFFYWENDKKQKYIIDGHHRKKFLLKMQDEGIKIPELYPSLEIEAKNKKEAVKELLFLNSNYGQITGTGLKELLQNYKIKAVELNQVRIKTSKVSLRKIVRDIEAEEMRTTNDEEIPENTTQLTKAGDIWELNHHKFICADSTKFDILATLLGDKKANMIFTDPPYNLSIKKDIGGNGPGIKDMNEFLMASGEMSEEEFISFLNQSFSVLVKYSVTASIHYICMDWRHTYELLIAARKNYTELKNVCVWNKDMGAMGTFYRSKHEFIFVYKNGNGENINNFLLGQHGRYRTNVWDYPQVNSFIYGVKNEEISLHPTVKPVGMLVECCLDCSNSGDIVLDTFLGSGTTVIACEKTDRVCYGVEIDPHYCDVIVNRWIKWMGENYKKIEVIKLNNKVMDMEIFNARKI